MSLCVGWKSCAFDDLQVEELSDNERMEEMADRNRDLRSQLRWVKVLSLVCFAYIAVDTGASKIYPAWVRSQKKSQATDLGSTNGKSSFDSTTADPPARQSTPQRHTRMDMLDHNMMSNENLSQQHDVKYERLRDWFVRNGGFIQGIEGRAAFAGGGRGLFATSSVHKNEEVLKVPAQLWLSEKNAHVASPVGHIIASDPKVAKFLGENTGENWPLVLMMEFETYNEFSFWKPYTDLIPMPASTIRYDASEIDQIESDTLKTQWSSNRKRITAVYNDIMKHLVQNYPNMFSEETNTIESFTASTCTAWSRTFNQELVPIADLLNHVTGTPNFPQYHKSLGKGDSGAHDRHEFRDEKGYSCKDWVGYDCFQAPRDEGLTQKGTDELIKACPQSCAVCNGGSSVDSIQRRANDEYFSLRLPEDKSKDDQIVISYGDHRTTMSWMLWAGFVPDESKYGDYYTITSNKHVTYVDINGIILDDFLLKVGASLTEANQQVSKDHWERIAPAMRHVLQGIKSKLDAFSTTLAADEVEANREGLDFKMHTILQARIRIKEMLHRTVDQLEHRLKTHQWAQKTHPKTILEKFGMGHGRASSKFKSASSKTKNALLTVTL